MHSAEVAAVDTSNVCGFWLPLVEYAAPAVVGNDACRAFGTDGETFAVRQVTVAPKFVPSASRPTLVISDVAPYNSIHSYTTVRAALSAWTWPSAYVMVGMHIGDVPESYYSFSSFSSCNPRQRL